MRDAFCVHDTPVAGCRSCAEVAALTSALLEDREQLMRASHLPSSSIVWWRAQARFRRDAERRASEPMTAAQGLTAACAAGVLAAAAGYVAPTFTRGVEWVTGALLGHPNWLPLAAASLAALAVTVATYVIVRAD